MSDFINSKDYWENRFKKDWKIGLGARQTAFFADIAMKNFPDWLIEDILRNNLSICDAGCAEGEFANRLTENFKNSEITGIDFSENAVSLAKSKYTKINFECADLTKLNKHYDVIVVSNTLEHFNNPFSIIKSLLACTNKHLIIMVPFQEYKWHEEHIFTFDYSDFPLKISDFFLTYSRIINTSAMPNSLWVGKQAIIVYTNIKTANLEEIPLLSSNNLDNITLFKMLIYSIVTKINEFKRIIYRICIKMIRSTK